MSWVAVAIGGSALIGAISNNNASKSAASAQANAAKSANATQLYMYNQQRDDYAPWREAGVGALGDIQSNQFMDNWKADPGYQFRMDEGMRAIQGSAAAKGSLNSGATLKALSRYGQDFASNEYNNVYNRNYGRLSQLAGFGNSATQNTANAGMNYGNSVANNAIGIGNAQAANSIAQSNNFNNLLGQGVQAYATYRGS